MNIKNRIKTLEKHFTSGGAAVFCGCFDKRTDELLYDDDPRPATTAGFDIEPDGKCAVCRLPVSDRVKEVCRQLVMYYG